MLHALVLAAEALPVGYGAEDAGAEQAIPLRLEGAVVDGLRLGDLAMRPAPDFFRRRQADADGIEIRNRVLHFERARTKQGVPPLSSAVSLPLTALALVLSSQFLVLSKTGIEPCPSCGIESECRSGLNSKTLHSFPALDPPSQSQLRTENRELVSSVCCRAGRGLFLPGLDQLHVEAERLQFADQHVERLRHARLHGSFALDDGLVNLGAAVNVVGLRRQQFLQNECRAVSFERPDFHFSETLSAELRLAAQWLLGDERVRPDGTRVNLVVH